MQPVLLFLAVAGLSVLATSPAIVRVARALRMGGLVSSGVLFLVLGAVLGPRGVGALAANALADLAPLVALGLGLAGMLVGLNLDVRVLRRVPVRAFLATWGESTFTFAAIAIPIAPLILFVGRQPIAASLASAALLGAAGSVSSDHLAQRAWRSGRLDAATGLSLSVVAMLEDGLALVALAAGIALGIGEGVAAGAQAVWLPLAIGAACGLLLAFLVLSASNRSELIAVVMGTLALGSGAAAYLKLSTLLAGVACGAVLSWVGGRRAGDVFRLLLRVERPGYLLLLFVVGAHVDPRNFLGWALAGVFIVARLGGKLLGGRLAKKLAGAALSLPKDPGYALIGQGAIALCIAIELRAMVPGFASQLLIDATAIGALANEVIAGASFRRALAPSPTPALEGAAK